MFGIEYYSLLLIFRVYVGVVKQTDLKGKQLLEIAKVFTPKERIEMYSQGGFHGTNDIALVKTKEPIIFVPGKVMPVRHFK